MPRLSLLISIVIWLSARSVDAQCPTLNQTATFTSSDCEPGSNPCVLCPGETFTLTPSGVNLQPGDCIDWYYGTTSTFNPYAGQGTFLGCSQITVDPPNPCNPDPDFMGILVNACGTEQNNEFFMMWSGGGFFVNNLEVDYDVANNAGGPQNLDIAAGGCTFQNPSAFLMNSITADCPGSSIIGVGPGDAVPPNVPVLVFTSSATDFNYNFAALCGVAGTIYVLQSGCARTQGAFTNTGSGLRTTTLSLTDCPWSESITYDLSLVTNVDGAFVADLPVVGVIYGVTTCTNFPAFPPLPGGPPPISVDPLTVTVTQDMCGGGPYFVTGIYDPLPAGCPQVFTNDLQFNVPCPSPNLSAGEVCENVTNYNLNQLEDPLVPNGVWSGPGVTGNTFNAVGQSGVVDLTFTPDGGCGAPAMTTITVYEVPTATFDPVSPVCAGGIVELVINFTGEGPWSFNLLANGSTADIVNTTDNPYTYQGTLGGSTTFTVSGFSDAHCNGANTSIVVPVSIPPAANMTLSGPNTICAGESTTLTIDFSNGTPPYTFEYSIDGVLESAITTNQDPYTFSTPPLNTTATLILETVEAGGCQGTVSGVVNVTVNEAPLGTLVSGTATVCTGQNEVLEFQFSGDGPYTFVYSINNVNQNPITTNNTTYQITVTPVTSSTYTLESVTNGTCDGQASGTFTVNIGSSGSAVISGTQTVCTGTSATLIIDFVNATGPYTFNYTANGLPQTAVTTNNDPYSLTVTPASVTEYLLTSASGNGCPLTVSGSALVSLAPALSAELSGGGQICTNGSGTTLTVTFNGAGPYTFTYSANNVNQGPFTTNTSPYIINVNPNIGTTYKLVSVSNPTCSGTFSGMATVFVFTPPSAEMSGSQVFCDSADTNVMIDFTGTGPFTVKYSINNVTQPPVTTFDDPFLIPVSVSSTTVYTLDSVSSPGCTGAPTGSATITVNYKPSYANLKLTCNPVTNNYIVTFDVLNAALPLTLTAGAGSFSGTQFTSAPISQTNGYGFTFHDANNCGDVVVSGPSNCNCVTQAGTMDLDTIFACAGAGITAVHNNNFVNDGNDSLRFILHDTPAIPLGNILAWSATPSFAYQPNFIPGQMYYVSAVAGNPNGNGQIDLNDLCLSVSQGTPVLFFPLPTASLGADTSVCVNTPFSFPVLLTGVPPFSLTFALNGVAQPPVNNINGGTYPINLQLLNNTLVTIVSVSDKRCSNNQPDSAQINIISAPQVSNVKDSCDLTTNTYILSFTVSGTPPFNVSGVAGSFAGNVFTSVPIPTAAGYDLMIGDAKNCGKVNLKGSSACSCVSNAGTLFQGLIVACQNETITVSPPTDAVLDPNDIIMYIIHENPGIPIGTIYSWNQTPVFNLTGGMQTDSLYYVSAIVGNPDGAGQILLSDPCLSVSAGTPVIFRKKPVADLGVNNINICKGDSVSLTVNFTGMPPFNFTYSIFGVPQPPVNNIAGNSYTWKILPQNSTVVQLTTVSDQNCSDGTLMGVANVLLLDVPSAQNIQTVCDPQTATYTLTFTVNGGSPPYTVIGQTGSFAGNVFTGTPIPYGTPYLAYLSDANNCGRDTVSGLADNCVCVTNAGTLNGNPLTLCAGETALAPVTANANLEPGDTLLYLLVSGVNPATWSVLAVNSVPSFAFNGATMTPNTPYNIVAIAGNKVAGGVNLQDPCFSFSVGPTVTWRPPVTAVLSGSKNICPGGNANLLVNLSGQGPFNLAYTGGAGQQSVNNITQNAASILVSPTTSTTYTLVSVSGAGGCTGTFSGNAVITVNNPPQAVNALSICDFAAQTYVLQFNISNGAQPNSIYTVTGLNGTVTDTSFTSTVLPASQNYSVTISDANGCTSTLSGESGCVCQTAAGSIGTSAITVCLPDKAVFQAASNAVLGQGDTLQYVLYSDAANPAQSIVAVSFTPEFVFQPPLVTGQTYYVAAVAGDKLANNNVDPLDPCLSVSPPVSLTFRNRPTAMLAGSDTLCSGGNTAFQIQFQGQAPFTFVYSINGSPQAAIPAPGNTFNISTNNVQQDQIFTLVSVKDAFCDGTANGMAEVKIQPGPEGNIQGADTICAGGTATLTLNLSGGSAYNVTINGGATPLNLTGIQNGHQLTVMPVVNTVYTIGTMSTAGNTCVEKIGPGAEIKVSVPGFNAALSQFNGFNVTCPGGSDGTISLAPNAGFPPYTAQWEHGASGLQLADLSAGSYAVTLTDDVGCTATGSYTLTEPAAVQVDYEVAGAACFGEENGELEITAITGGAQPYKALLDGQALDPTALPAVIDDLAGGDHDLEIVDANDCKTIIEIKIPQPPKLEVYIGEDKTLSLGDSLFIDPFDNAVALDTFFWSHPQYMADPKEYVTFAKPPVSTAIGLTIVDENGCTATDVLNLAVRKENRVFLPTIFKPFSTTNNDFFTVFAGSEVVSVKKMQIFDRWGDMMFENTNFKPNLPQLGWDGKFRGKDVNPGVYIYVIELEYFDGTTLIYDGGVTVIR